MGWNDLGGGGGRCSPDGCAFRDCLGFGGILEGGVDRPLRGFGGLEGSLGLGGGLSLEGDIGLLVTEMPSSLEVVSLVLGGAASLGVALEGPAASLGASLVTVRAMALVVARPGTVLRVLVGGSLGGVLPTGGPLGASGLLVAAFRGPEA